MPSVLAVHRSHTHSFTKHPESAIRLLAGLGVEGDAHCGATVRHRYLARRSPSAPNLMQVHLLSVEFLDVLANVLSPAVILPGQLGENVTTVGLDLESLPLASRLRLGADAVIELTGLRTPCRQMNTLHPALMKAAFVPGSRSPRAGVMGIVLSGGLLHPSDGVGVSLPSPPHLPQLPI